MTGAEGVPEPPPQPERQLIAINAKTQAPTRTMLFRNRRGKAKQRKNIPKDTNEPASLEWDAGVVVCVVTVTVNGWLLPGVISRLAGERVHVAYCGAPEQLRAATPLRPVLPVIARA